MRVWIVVAALAISSAADAQAVVSAQDEPHGLALELGLGAGYVRTGGPYSRLDGVTRGGSLAVGLWLTPRTALTLRAAVQTYHWVNYDDTADFRYWFVGPSVQRWLTPRIWVSGGAGYAAYQDLPRGFSGVGLDLRAGVAGALAERSPHRFAAWIEVIPATYHFRQISSPPGPLEWDVFVATTINVGYQLQ